MKNKKSRLQLILDIIHTQSVGSQEELVGLLAEKGNTGYIVARLEKIARDESCDR